MTFAVLNPGGRDANQSFPAGAGKPDEGGHPPVNYHAYAACRRGGFYREIRALPEEVRTVLILLRKRNLRKALAAVQHLKSRGINTLVSCKESGAHQIADFLGDVTRLELFREICTAADGAISSTPDLVEVYRVAGCREVRFVPTPYPVDSKEWDFSQPPEKRRGIFIGTREFSVPSRNHLTAVLLADELSREIGCALAVVNTEGRSGGMILKSLRKKNPLLFIIEAPLAYPDYLRVMALHRIVWQLDSSSVPGQVAGDALLCRMPCLGGNGAVDRIAFPGLSGPAERSVLAGAARSLLTDDGLWLRTVEASMATAMRELSFEAGASRLS